MATVVLSTQIPLTELINIIKISYPTYICTIKGSRINVDTGVQGKMEIFFTGKKLVVVPKINLILAFIIGLTVVGFFLLLIAFNINPLAKEIANSIANNINKTQPILNSVESIPETCPHCKNPNSKQIRICEWCGGQII